MPGNLHLIEMDKGSNGMGLSLAGNRDLSTMSVFVCGIKQDSTTARDGRIHIGDEILEVSHYVVVWVNTWFESQP